MGDAGERQTGTQRAREGGKRKEKERLTDRDIERQWGTGR